MGRGLGTRGWSREKEAGLGEADPEREMGGNRRGGPHPDPGAGLSSCCEQLPRGWGVDGVPLWRAL